MAVNRRGHSHRRVAKDLRDDLDRDAIAQHPGRGRVAPPVRIKVNPGPASQPLDQVIDGRVAKCPATWPAEQVDEYVIGVQPPVPAGEIASPPPQTPRPARTAPP